MTNEHSSSQVERARLTSRQKDIPRLHVLDCLVYRVPHFGFLWYRCIDDDRVVAYPRGDGDSAARAGTGNAHGASSEGEHVVCGCVFEMVDDSKCGAGYVRDRGEKGGERGVKK